MQKNNSTIFVGSNILFNISILLNSLLAFLLLAGSRFELPSWLQVAGRMHPLLLHFPIVLLLIYVVYILVAQNLTSDSGLLNKYADAVLLWAAFTASLTALMGLFLSGEEGYDSDALALHKYSGAATSFIALIWYYFRNAIRKTAVVRYAGSALMIGVLFTTGHQGANITHGEGFLLAPIQTENEEAAVPLADAMTFEHIIKPILASKCLSCHSSQKAKGELIMETPELILKGGKSGKLWDHHSAGSGLMLERLWLPMEEKKHMPPKGKPQLTAEETELLQRWIASGANFNQPLASLPANDSFYLLAAARINANAGEAYDFEAASSTTIQQLNSENRVVQEEAISSPALIVQFFNSNQFKSTQLDELEKVRKQIVAIDLTRMALNEKDLQTIAKFENIRRLNLSFTKIEGSWLKHLVSLTKLKSLSVSGNSINSSDLTALGKLPQLQQLFAWQTGSSQNEWKAFQKKFPSLSIETGFNGDSIKLKLSAPVLQNDLAILTGPTTLQLKHYINGAEIRYTLDGSEPDSIKSAVYNGKEIINDNVLIRARAYKPGWYSSDLLEANLYKSTIRPDSVILETSPDDSYKGKPELLTDLTKGELNFRDGNWMAWRGRNMELLLPLPKHSIIKSVTLGSLVDIGSYIMPPVKIEIWGGNEPGKMKKLGEIQPEQPAMMKPIYLRGFECRFEPTEVNFLRIIAKPVQKLPAWHPGKGDKGWFFIDEILLN